MSLNLTIEQIELLQDSTRHYYHFTDNQIKEFNRYMNLGLYEVTTYLGINKDKISDEIDRMNSELELIREMDKIFKEEISRLDGSCFVDFTEEEM